MKNTPSRKNIPFLAPLTLAILLISGCITGELKEKVLGTQKYVKEDYEAAVPELQKSLIQNPSDERALRMLAWNYYHLKEYPKAEKAFMDYGRVYPSNPEVYKGLAWTHYQTGEVSRSAQEFKNWLSIRPDSKEAREGLAVCYIELGQDAEALKELQGFYSLGEMTFKFPDWHYPFFLLGQESMENKEYGQAHHYLQTALQLSPQFVPAEEALKDILEKAEKRIQLARQYQENERYPLAVRFYIRVSEEFPFWAKPYIGLGESYLKMGRFQDAEASFRKALYLDPQDERARQGIQNTVNQRDPNLLAAWENYAKGDYMGAVAAFEMVVQGPGLFNIPEDERWAVYHGLAWSYYHTGHNDEAQENFQESLRLKSNEPESLKGLGLVYYRGKNFAPAEMFLEMAVKAGSTDAELPLTLGKIYFLEGKFDKAAAQFETVLAHSPNNFEVRRDLAWAMYKFGDKDRAKEEFSRLLAMDPSYIQDEDFRQLIASTPQWWEFSNALGWRYYEKKRFSAAAAAFRSSLEQEPRNPGALMGLGFSLFQEENYAGAMENLLAVVKGGAEIAPVTEEDPAGYLHQIESTASSKLAWTYYFMGKFKEAAEQFKEVTGAHPGWVNPLYGQALAWKNLEQHDEAEKTFQLVLAKNPGHAGAMAGIQDIQKLKEENKKKEEEDKKKEEGKKKKKKGKKKKKVAKIEKKEEARTEPALIEKDKGEKKEAKMEDKNQKENNMEGKK